MTKHQKTRICDRLTEDRAELLRALGPRFPEILTTV